MTTEERAAIARANGAKSKGPKTEQGKARSSQNARKHGEFAQKFTPHSTVACNEDHAQYKTLLRECTEIYAPVNAIAYTIVQSIASARWQIERLNHCLTMHWNLAVIDGATQPAQLTPDCAETETMGHASRALHTGHAVAERLNRQIDQLELRIARLERRLVFVHKHFPAVQTQPNLPEPQENKGNNPELTTGNEPVIVVTESNPKVIEAYKQLYPGTKIVVLPPDHVAQGIGLEDDMPVAPRKAA